MNILAEAALRITVLAIGVALLLRTLRIRSPRLAHGAWTVVLIVMLLLPVIVASGAQFGLPLLPPQATRVFFSTNAGDAAEGIGAAQRTGTSMSVVPGARGVGSRVSFTVIAATVYLAGVALLLGRLVIGFRYASALRSAAVRRQGRWTHPACVTPVTVGLLVPDVILPPDWTDWDSAELSAVLAHEEEHARRRDPLIAGLALFNRAIFWFHPLAWWLQRRLVRLSEQACDAAVIAHGHDREFYSACLLRFARRAAHAGGRVVSVGMAMPGAGLHERLGVLAHLETTAPSRLRVAGAALVCAALLVVCAAAVPTAALGQNATGAAGQVEWHVDTSEHFEIVHDNLPADLVADAIGDAEAAYAQLAAALKFDMPRRVSIVLVRRDRDLAGAIGHGPDLPSQSVAPYQQRQRVLISLESLDRRPDLIVHELTHQFAFEIVPATSRLTPVLIEGLAQHQRGAWDVEESRLVRDDTVARAIPSVANLDTTDRHWAHAVFDFVGGQQGEEGIRRLLFALRMRETMALAVPMAFDVTLDQFDEAFRGYATARFGRP